MWLIETIPQISALKKVREDAIRDLKFALICYPNIIHIKCHHTFISCSSSLQHRSPQSSGLDT